MKAHEAVEQIRSELGDEQSVARVLMPITRNVYTLDQFIETMPGMVEVNGPVYSRSGDTSTWTMELANGAGDITVVAIGVRERPPQPPPEDDYEAGVKRDLVMMFCDLRDTIKYAQPNEVFRVESPAWFMFNVRGGQLIEEVLWELVDQDMGWSIPQADEDDVIRVYPTFEPEALLKFDPKPGFADHWTEDEEEGV